MKKESVKLLVIVIVGLLVYLTFFIEEVEDIPKKQDTIVEIEKGEQMIDTLFNEKGYLVIGKPNEVKLITMADSSKYLGFYTVGVYKDDLIIAKNRDIEYLEIYKERLESITFEDYKMSIYTGRLAAPKFESNPEAKQFITRIKEGCKEGINFAGQYTLIYWGCGTACQYGVIVDRKTGKIYNGYTSSMGSDFRKDSKLIIFESGFIDGDEKYIPLDQFKKIEFKTWNGDHFEKLN